ncbi:Phosphorylated adapter RNA export protein [Abeliophyllum distichum]|uniref:Phosphorylated adapter RNA export protein n=1 Tax=Abeliophyllum distichum TaxID=126358 RepID=A0ABD1UM43_9LAMI
MQVTYLMEGGDSILDTIFEEESLDEAQDVEMHDVEEGELIDQTTKAESGDGFGTSIDKVNHESHNKNSRNKKKKKKNKRRRGNSGPNVTDIDRFVKDVCKRLRERKSYLVWTAVGCLGVSTLSDLVKEVDAIQACGGQKTADGRRFRSGGGILWSIIKVRDPNSYKEIMKKGKEFEKQFKQQVYSNSTDQVAVNFSDGLKLESKEHIQFEQLSDGQKRAPVHDRIRMPVSYDDLFAGEDSKD